ncbi:unnamed protein product, partial [Sphacelaria rigidula]
DIHAHSVGTNSFMYGNNIPHRAPSARGLDQAAGVAKSKEEAKDRSASLASPSLNLSEKQPLQKRQSRQDEQQQHNHDQARETLPTEMNELTRNEAATALLSSQTPASPQQDPSLFATPESAIDPSFPGTSAPQEGQRPTEQHPKNQEGRPSVSGLKSPTPETFSLEGNATCTGSQNSFTGEGAEAGSCRSRDGQACVSEKIEGQSDCRGHGKNLGGKSVEGGDIEDDADALRQGVPEAFPRILAAKAPDFSFSRSRFDDADPSE